MSAFAIDVWSYSVDRNRGLSSGERAACLSAKERDRAGRFLREEDRIRYEVAHVGVRQILASYANVTPGELRFGENAFGKPFLLGEFSRIRFNLSHSGDRIAIAVSLDGEVGIDVEQIDRRVNTMDLAGRFFAPIEAASVGSRVDGGGDARRFFEIWTGKESYIKWRGMGLSLPLDSFSLSEVENGRAGATDHEGEDNAFVSYSFSTDGYYEAVCCGAADARIVYKSAFGSVARD